MCVNLKFESIAFLKKPVLKYDHLKETLYAEEFEFEGKQRCVNPTCSFHSIHGDGVAFSRLQIGILLGNPIS